MRALILAPLLAGACSLSLDESLILHDGGSSSGGAQSEASIDGSSGWGATAGDSSASGGSDASSGGSSTGGASGGTGGTDAGADASGGGGGTPTPGAADCDNEICDVTTTMCCKDPQAGSAACQDLSIACAGVTILCDSAEDCGAGQTCCLADLQNVSCQDTCPSTQFGGVQFCKTDSECGPGMTCSGLITEVAALVPASYSSCQ